VRPATKGFLASLALLTACVLVFAMWGCSERAIPHSGPKPPCLMWMPVSGRSMLPKYPESHLLEVDVAFSYDNLKVGDEVVFWDYKRPVGIQYTFHAIVGKQGAYFIVKGLNPATNPIADAPWLTRDNFIGKATGRSTYLLAAAPYDP
jgi:hypothetical protein